MKCQNCQLYKGAFSNCMGGIGFNEAEVLILGSYPTKDEDNSGRIFQSDSNIELKKAFNFYGLDYKKYRFSNIIKCASRGKVVDNEIMWACREHLVEEIKAMPNLRIILGLGGEVYHVLTTTNKPKKKPIALGKHRGVVIHLDEFNVDFVPTYNPFAILKNPKFRDNFYDDIKTLSVYLSGKEKLVEIDYNSIYLFEDVDWFFNQLFEQEEVAFDIETTSIDSPFGARLLCITFSWKEGQAFYLPINEGDNGNYWINNFGSIVWFTINNRLGLFFNNAKYKKIGHNMKYDVKYYEVIQESETKIEVNGIYFDTMLAHYLMNVDALHDLKTLSRQYTDLENYEDLVQEEFAKIKKDKNIPDEKKNYGSIDIDLLREYALTDADATFRLYKQFKPIIDAASYKGVFYDILMPLTRVLLDAEKAGVRVDKELMLELQADYANKLQAIQEEVDLYIFCSKAQEVDLENYQQCLDYVNEKQLPTINIMEQGRYTIVEMFFENFDYTFLLLDDGLNRCFAISTQDYPDYKFSEINFRSPLQLRKFLFNDKPEGLGLSSVKLTPAGSDSTDKDSLEILNRIEKNPILDNIVKYRNFANLKSTFIDGMLESIDLQTGNLHPNYNLHGTKTGRISCKRPNFLNIPKDSEDAGKIRNIFLPNVGNYFVDGDAAQAEFRILCEYSKDPVMLKLFEDNIDIHRHIAAHIYKIAEEQVSKKQRDFVKAIVFGTMYGKGAKSTAIELSMPEREAQAIQNYFFSLCPGGKKWLDDQAKFVKKNKYVKTLFGRIRPLYDVDSSEPGIASATLREAVNTPIQGAASDYVLVALINIYNEIKKRGLKALPKITVYDSIIVDTPVKEAKEVYAIMEDYMTRKIKPVHLVPMKAEIKIVDRWSGNEVEL